MPSPFTSAIAKQQKPGEIFSGKVDHSNNFQQTQAVDPGRFGEGTQYGASGPQSGWDTGKEYTGEQAGSRWSYSPSGGGWVLYGGASNPLQQQQFQAMDFRANAPQMQNTLYNQLSADVNQAAGQGIRAVKQKNSSRGLLYGGINAGNEQGVRATASGQLAKGRSAINQGVMETADQIEQGAINTGLQIQNQQQQMQNAIYANAIARMNADNSQTAGLLSAGGMVLGGYLAGG